MAKRSVGSHEPDDDEAVLKWLLLAYPDRVVKRRGADRTGVMVGGRGVRLGPESVVRDADLYLALDAREDRRAGGLRSSGEAGELDRARMARRIVSGTLRRERLTHYDEARRRVVSANQLWYHDLLVREDLSAAVDPDEAGLVLAEALRPVAGRSVPRERSGGSLARATGFCDSAHCPSWAGPSSTTRCSRTC